MGQSRKSITSKGKRGEKPKKARHICNRGKGKPQNHERTRFTHLKTWEERATELRRDGLSKLVRNSPKRRSQLGKPVG